MKVVIADDNKLLANGIASLIEKQFPQFTIDGVFFNGKALMSYLDTEIPDLLITDIRMHNFNGLDACQKLRDSSSVAQIIILTGYAEFDYAKRAISCRVHEFIVKPFDNKVLIDAISSATHTYILPLVKSYVTSLRRVNVKEFISRHAEEIHALSDDQLLFLLQEAAKDFPIDAEFKTLITPNREEALLSFANLYHTSTAQMYLTKQAKQFIRTHYANPTLSLTMIAEALSTGASHLSSTFKRESNQGLNEFITNVRIDHAKKLLRETTLPIQQVSELAGFTSHKYFAQVFKDTVGLTASQYQRMKTHEEN